MSFLDQSWFSHIRHPSRYLGNEINSAKKDLTGTEVCIALAFPDVYEVGMSHLGLRILYDILNSHPWLAAERVFSPGTDLEVELRRRKLPLTTLESQRPLSSFDVVGFSLQHELCYTNVLNMLDLCGIPFLSSERGSEHPLIVAGGPACFNPEPVADLFDAMVIGDGELAAVQICQKVKELKQGKIKSKQELLVELCRVSGIYVPSFFHPQYGWDGTVDFIESIAPAYSTVEKAILLDINKVLGPERQIVPFTELIHDRLVLEICRGCTRGCRFCQAGMIYRPVRERNPEAIVQTADRALELTGYEDLSLLSLSSGDYSCLQPLLRALMDRQSDNKVAISLPSLRVDSFDPTWMEEIKRVRKTGFTLAAEAGSERLRNIINKNLSEADILNMAREVYKAGWNLIKLYFMIGLPGEQEEDLLSIIRLAKRIVHLGGKKGGRHKLNVSVATFVPKSHTPFMWVPQISLEESRRRIQLIRQGLKGTPIRVKWNEPELSWLEGIFSRGDRKLIRAIVEAWKLGAKFDAWGEHFQLAYWEQAFKKTNIKPSFYLHRERSAEEVFPWEHIRCGVTKSFFRREWERALQGRLTPDCREGCLECGVCDHETVDPIIIRKWQPEGVAKKPLKGPAVLVPQKYRLTFTKLNEARYLSHLELARVLVRALRRTGVHLVYSGGYHPMPKVSFLSALAVGIESAQETVDVTVSGSLQIRLFKETINAQLPEGIKVTLLERMSSDDRGLRLKESHFLVKLDGIEVNKENLDRFLDRDYFPVSKMTQKGLKEVNARALVKRMDFLSPSELRLTLRHIPGPQVRPTQILKEIFSIEESRLSSIRILKVKQVLE